MKALVLTVLMLQALPIHAEALKVGSKNFTESYILGELLSTAIERQGGTGVQRTFGLGGTGITFEALRSGEIDVYAEYIGTLAIEVFKAEIVDPKALATKLAEMGLRLSAPLGFRNSYGIAVPRAIAEARSLKRLSDLAVHKDLQYAFSYEFLNRRDGYPGLRQHYGIAPNKPPKSMVHSLLYGALEGGGVEAIEVYTTDPQIAKLDLVVLEDDREYFPNYDAVFVYRQAAAESAPVLLAAMRSLGGRIRVKEMIRLNSLVEIDHQTFAEASATVFDRGQSPVARPGAAIPWLKLLRLTKEHALLVFLSLAIAILLGVPMGIVSASNRFLGSFFLAGSGIMQTVPSLALLCFLIPLVGIGVVPSMIALTLYALLPIVRGTYTGLRYIDPSHREIALTLGLSPWERLIRIEIPLAVPSIMAGVQTAVVTNVGVATLAAFVGAGGYGTLIVSGLALNDTAIILLGAVPAAAMAVLVHFFFEWISRLVTPRGLQIKPAA